MQMLVQRLEFAWKEKNPIHKMAHKQALTNSSQYGHQEKVTSHKSNRERHWCYVLRESWVNLEKSMKKSAYNIARRRIVLSHLTFR